MVKDWSHSVYGWVHDRNDIYHLQNMVKLRGADCRYDSTTNSYWRAD